MCQTDTFQVKSHRVLSDTISDLNDWYYNTQFDITEQRRSRVSIMNVFGESVGILDVFYL